MPSTIHCAYYCCWYILCNTDGRYTKQVLDYGADISISNFNYGFNFWFSFSISHFILFYFDLFMHLQN
jgi:hypothetical protein